MKHAHAINKKVFWLRIYSALVLTYESACLSAWRVLSWTLLFAALWLFQIPESLGTTVEHVVPLIFVLGFVVLAFKDFDHFSFPTLEFIDRRIESDSLVKDRKLKDRPLSGLKDQLANDQKTTARQLWGFSQRRFLTLLDRLRLPFLHGVVTPKDPYALRFLVLLCFGLGLIVSGPEASMRLKSGLMPYSISLASSGASEHFTLIITPPDYTSLPQLVITPRTAIPEGGLRIPEGSSVKAVLNSAWWATWMRPSLKVDTHRYAFESMQDEHDSFALDITLPELDVSKPLPVETEENEETQQNSTLDLQKIVIKQGIFPLKTIAFHTVLDTPPGIELLSEKPNIHENGQMSFSLSVRDDYGVEYLDMDMSLDANYVPAKDAPLGSPISIRRSVISPDGEDFEITPLYDLTASPWAGLPAVISFSAIDETGQRAALDPIPIVLPERDFHHPIAKTLIKLRQKLIWSPFDQKVYDESSYDLQVLHTAKDFMHNDVVVYMAIRSASLRLQYNEPSIETTRSVISLLWDTALRVEDGDLSLAQRRLREAQLALEEALQNPNISQDEISRLMDDLRSAMQAYMQEMAKELSERMARGEDVPLISPDMMNQSLNSDALQDFIDQMEMMMREGNTQSAQEMLSQMQRLMDMVNPSMNAQLPPDMEMMRDGIHELQTLIERQEDLLSQTMEQADMLRSIERLQNSPLGLRLPNGVSPSVNTQENKTEQEALRYVLGQLMLEANDALGEIPENMGMAEQDMRQSSESLGKNQPIESIPFQNSALENLKKAQESLSQQLQQRMIQMTGMMLSLGQPGGMQRDPLGREMPYGDDGDPNNRSYGSNVKVPDQSEKSRIQEILKLLRQRAGQHERSREELEYYRRLLKRF